MGLTCMCCGSTMPNLMEGEGVQPARGLAFETAGHYGSAFFDPMDGSQIVACICDVCLNTNAHRLTHFENGKYTFGMKRNPDIPKK